MTLTYLQSASDCAELTQAVREAQRIALDCEAAGFHRYSDRLCLVQLTVGPATYVIDPLAFDPRDVLREPLEREDLSVIMHGADFDLRLIRRDLGIRIRGLVDTQVLASLLGEQSLGLASLLESRLGVRLSKAFQRADWARRPLSEDMLEYAADDTRHLPRLVDRLSDELEAKGRLGWAEEECRALETVADDTGEDEEVEDPVTRIKGARHLPVRDVAALREALEWRDDIARRRDKALFRVIADKPLIEAVSVRPRRVEDLLAVKGFPKSLAHEEGKRLIGRLRALADVPEEELQPYPRTRRRGSGRPPPELESTVDRLKGVRDRVASELGLAKGVVLSNATILEVARARPTSVDALSRVDGMRRWRAEVLGASLVEVLAQG